MTEPLPRPLRNMLTDEGSTHAKADLRGTGASGSVAGPTVPEPSDALHLRHDREVAGTLAAACGR